MARRRRSNSGISFFAFQDIITSVTAIIIVVVLLLALDLTQQDPGTVGMPLVLAEELEQRIDAIRAELDDVKSRAEAADDVIQDITNQTPEEIKNEIAARGRDIEDLRSKLERQTKYRNDWEAREQAALVKKYEQEPLRQELEQLQRELAGLRKQSAEEVTDDRPIFTLPQGLNKTGWLVVVDADRISTAPIGMSVKPRVFATSNSLFGKTAAEHFAKWIGTDSHRSDYFLVLIRPDGSATYDLLAGELEGLSVSFGYDLIDQSQEIFHPERGAAP